MQFVEPGSAKDRENTFYRIWALWHSGIETLNEETDKWNPFFFANGQEVNKSIIAEMGRLLLTGWYYNVEPFCVDVCQYVYKSYLIKSQEFNELEYSKRLKQIRDNIGYYYHHQDDLKLFILESFFKSELQPLLPERPELLRLVDDLLQGQRLYKAKKLKQDKDFFFKKCEMQELYIAYLQEALEANGITYDEYEDFETQQKQECDEFAKEYTEAAQQYRDQVRGKALENVKLLMQA
jgi:hypothetical protein